MTDWKKTWPQIGLQKAEKVHRQLTHLFEGDRRWHGLSLQHENTMHKLTSARYHHNWMLTIQKENYHSDLDCRSVLKCEFEAFLFALVGAIDSLFREINVVFRGGLPRPYAHEVVREMRKRHPDDFTCYLQDQLDQLKHLRQLRGAATHSSVLGKQLFVRIGGGLPEQGILIPDNPNDEPTAWTTESNLELFAYAEKALGDVEHLIERCSEEIEGQLSDRFWDVGRH